MPIAGFGPAWVVVVVFAALAAGGSPPTPAHAHDAPSGWPYPQECCSGQDCRPLKASQVRPGYDGYLIHSSGEIVVYSDSRVRKSPDGGYHWCSNGGRDDGRTICLFVPEELF
ncbi:MAG: hypothetical protein KDJ90_09870 [Nitratireductor sp.]|nr:hypothetical protein [Nitratireductor sp.]